MIAEWMETTYRVEGPLFVQLEGLETWLRALKVGATITNISSWKLSREKTKQRMQTACSYGRNVNDVGMDKGHTITQTYSVSKFRSQPLPRLWPSWNSWFNKKVKWKKSNERKMRRNKVWPKKKRRKNLTYFFRYILTLILLLLTQVVGFHAHFLSHANEYDANQSMN